ncbi:MAG: hypothetical protein HPY50_18875 [Firmicutes bacterium]|nr:hypothetical protein [Bacillota bacterium]
MEKKEYPFDLEQMFKTSEWLYDRMWDYWTLNLGAYSWISEWWETQMTNMIEHNRSTRSEMMRVAQEMSGQMRKSSAGLDQMLKDMTRASLETMYNLSDDKKAAKQS